MVLLAIRAVPLAAHLMVAAKLAVIGGEDDDRLIHAIVFERLQHADDLAVAIADAIIVIVSQQPPTAILIRPGADENILDL